jgi:hypothetical protein
MDIEKICIANLGKEIMYGKFKGMIVGYNTALEYLIISFTDDCGWNFLTDTDIILLNSPLNHSYVLANPKYYKEQLIL